MQAKAINNIELVTKWPKAIILTERESQYLPLP